MGSELRTGEPSAGVRTHARSALTLLGALVLGFGAPAEAQRPHGRVSGRVIGTHDAEPLVNAQVYIPEANTGVLTDLDGRYVLTGVPPGTHTLVVQYVGYATKTITGVKVDGVPVTLDITLTPQAIPFEAITVTATRERGSNAALLADRMRAPVVVDAIGSEQIAGSPDGDAAAALKRVPGVSVVDGKYVYVRGLGERYGNTTLNGAPLPSPEPDRKVVPLDIVPSSLLESVVTAKTYSPDQPGDHAGGLVQINTRDFSGLRLFKVGASVAYNSTTSFADGLGYAGGGLDYFGFDDGTRDLPVALPEDSPLNGLSSGDLERVGEAFAGAWGPAAEKLPLNHGFGFTFGDEIEVGDRLFSFLGSITQSNSYSHRDGQIERVLSSAGAAEPEVDYLGRVSTHSVALGGLLDLGYRIGTTGRVSLNTILSRLTDDEARTFEGFNLDSNTDQRNMRLRYLSQSLIGSQLAGEHRVEALGGTGLKWRAAYSKAERFEPNTREMLYREVADGRFLWENFIQSASLFHQDMDERGVSGGLDLRVPFGFRSLPASVSFGASADLRKRETYTRRLRFVPAGAIPESVRERAPDAMLTAETIGPDGFQIQDATFRTDNYDAEHRILAAYLMADAEVLPRLRLVGGARIEKAEQTVTPRDPFDPGLEALEGARLDATDVLPGFNLTLSITDEMNLRAGVSRTLARPQLRELAPFAFADYAGGFLVLGNTLLERSRIRNYDLRWEWVPRPGALVAVSGFYKRFDDPIEVLVLPSTELKKTWVNAGEATHRGVEIELRSTLGFLAHGLEALSVNTNVTLVESSVATGGPVRYSDAGQRQNTTLPGRDRALQGQSPYVVNVGLSYAQATLGTRATVFYNRFGRRIDAVGSASLPDIYEDARDQLDIVIEQPLPQGFSVKLAANRLLGNEVRFTQGGDVVRQYRTGRTLSLSTSWSPGGN